MLDITKDAEHIGDYLIMKRAIEKGAHNTRGVKVTKIRGDGSVWKNYREEKDTICSKSERV